MSRLDYTRDDSFNNCNFFEIDLADMLFIDCEFIDCNLSMACVDRTAFRNVKFNNSKLLGVNFEQCNNFAFEVSFTNCGLNNVSFYGLKLKKTIFTDCALVETDFGGSDLSNAKFIRCNLMGAIFDGTNLEKADFSLSYNYVINPEHNNIAKAIFSSSGLSGLLMQYNIKIVD